MNIKQLNEELGKCLDENDENKNRAFAYCASTLETMAKQCIKEQVKKVASLNIEDVNENSTKPVTLNGADLYMMLFTCFCKGVQHCIDKTKDVKNFNLY